jgi:hypothetical protein
MNIQNIPQEVWIYQILPYLFEKPSRTNKNIFFSKIAIISKYTEGTTISKVFEIYLKTLKFFHFKKAFPKIFQEFRNNFTIEITNLKDTEKIVFFKIISYENVIVTIINHINHQERIDIIAAKGQKILIKKIKFFLFNFNTKNLKLILLPKKLDCPVTMFNKKVEKKIKTISKKLTAEEKENLNNQYGISIFFFKKLQEMQNLHNKTKCALYISNIFHSSSEHIFMVPNPALL